MVTKRQFLALGTSSLVFGLSGCTASVPFVGHPEVRERPDDPLERVVPRVFSEGTPPPISTLVVGEGTNQTHQVWVWNRTEERRAIELRIGPESDPWFEQSYEFDADDSLAIDLRTAREYEMFVTVGDRETRVRVEKSDFDCNESATDVLVKKTETVTQTISTDAGCGGGVF